MNFFSIMLFHKLFSIYSECSGKYNKETEEYKECIKLQQFNDQLLQEFLQQNQELLAQYIKMLQDAQNKEFLMQMYTYQKKIDNEINQYLSYEEQREFLIEYFNLEDMFKGFEFDR